MTVHREDTLVSDRYSNTTAASPHQQTLHENTNQISSIFYVHRSALPYGEVFIFYVHRSSLPYGEVFILYVHRSPLLYGEVFLPSNFGTPGYPPDPKNEKKIILCMCFHIMAPK